MTVGNDSLLALPWHKGSEISSKLQRHIGNSTVQVFREWGHATIVCWHYNATGVQRMGACYNSLLALQWHRGSENRGRQPQFVDTTNLQGQTITVCCCLRKEQ